MVGPRLPLATPMLDRAAHRRRDQDWLAGAWQRARVLIVDTAAGGRALVRDGADGMPRLVLRTARQLTDIPPARRLFLGVEADGVPVFAVDAPLEPAAGPPGRDARAVTLRDVGHLLSDRDGELFVTAVALAQWHARHAFSPMTGRPTTVGEGGWVRVDEDGATSWPRTDPAMIVVVHDGVAGPEGRCLLGNNAAWRGPEGTRGFSCLAGFVEPGESAEAAVAREVREEVGVEISRIRYEGSQGWPFPGSLMLGFTAYADPAQPLRVDHTEIAEARWFTRGEICAALAGERVEVGGGRRLRLPVGVSIAAFLVTSWATETSETRRWTGA